MVEDGTDDPESGPHDAVEVTVLDDGDRRSFSVPRGTNLREALLARGHSPYTALTRRANCGGRGICATCGVRIRDGEPAPEHWHDRLADRFGYPRLSCQVSVEDDLAIRIPEKLVWGDRRPDGDGVNE